MQQERQSAWEGAAQFADFSGFQELGRWPLLDAGRALDSLGGDVVAFREVAQVFLDHLPAAVAALSEPATPRELLPVVHELGSSLGSVGAMRAHRVARTIEERWRTGDLNDAARATALLKEMVAASAQALAAAISAPAR